MFCIVFDLAMVVISSRLARVCLKTAFAELNERLPDVANVIYEHDTTGMAEPFHVIDSRLKNVFVDAVQKDRIQENANILIVTHPFGENLLYKNAGSTLDKGEHRLSGSDGGHHVGETDAGSRGCCCV
jgi:hypothetical protein